MGSSSRYLEAVPPHTAQAGQLVDVWCGEEEEDDGLRVQRERLELRADGSFEHRLEHELLLLAGDSKDKASSCNGVWHLSNVRHLGADASAPADQEITFDAAQGSAPLFVNHIVVCGQNPRVNGFTGHVCRLYPEQRGQVDQRQQRQSRGRGVNDESCGLMQGELQRENQGELEDADQPVEVNEAEVKQLSDMTGCSADECHAALLQNGGSLEEAAVQLLERPPERPRERTEEPVDEQAEAQGAAYLAEATGRQLSECRTALRAHGGSIDQAVATLLSLPPTQASGSSSGPPALSKEGGAVSPDEANQAAMVSEATGRALPACLAALRSCGGRAEDAVMALLDAGPAALPGSASGASGAGDVAVIAHAGARGAAADGTSLGSAEVGLDFEDPLGLGDSPTGLQPVGPSESPIFMAPAGEAHDIAAELGLASPSPLRGDPDAETDPEAEAPQPKRPRQDDGEN